MKKLLLISAIFIFTITSLVAETNSKYKQYEAKEAEFFYGKFVQPDDTTTEPDLIVSIPSDWNKYDLPEYKEFISHGDGSGTYRITFEDLEPETEYSFETYNLGYTAFRVLANGQNIFQCGEPYEDWEKTVPNQEMDFATFKTDKNGNATISILVSNNMYRKGGLRGDLKIMEASAAKENFLKQINLYMILSGILLTIVFYTLLLFILTKEKTNLYLSLFVFILFTRIVTNVFPIPKYLFPSISYSLMLKIEYIAVFFAPPVYTLYLYEMNKNIFKLFNPIFVCIPGFILLILDFALPIRLANRLVPYMQYYMFAIIFFCGVAVLIQILKNKDFVSIVSLFTFSIIGVGAALNILVIHHVSSVFSGNAMLAISFVLYAIGQIIVLAYIHNQNLLHVEELNKNLIETNKAYYRFVPREFLDLFNKTNITEVTLGEKKEAKMAILSADIRNFTSISETMTEKQVFDMLNSYLRVIAPIIRKHNGIIEKYLGDGIIAIFPSAAEEAILCALEMQEQMIELRKEFLRCDFPEIKIGVGIHYGNVIIGTGGDEERMTEISLSNDIDIAVKTEAATKTYKTPIIATNEVLKQASIEARKQNRKFNFYGKQIFDGKVKLFSIYNEITGTVL